MSAMPERTTQRSSLAAEVLPFVIITVGVPLLLWWQDRRAKRRRRSGLGRQPKQWWDKPAPFQHRACYQTKTDALNAFLDWNTDVVEGYGGPSYRVSPAEFDAINHKYGLKGKKAVRTIAQAVWAAMPPG